MTQEKLPPSSTRFWENKTLSEMTHIEWESLCDGCGHCCLIKLQDEDSDEIYLTNVACHLLDLGSCRCQDYPHRLQQVEMCMQLSPDNLSEVNWLPETCAYRCLAEQRSLPVWHPLLSGQADSVREAGVSVIDFAVAEEAVHPEQLEDHIIDDGL